MQVDALDYVLPQELIAQHPPVQREQARLLVAERESSRLAHTTVEALPTLLPPALFVFNDTRVIPARITGQRAGGGAFEVLLVERQGGSDREERWLAMARPLKRLRPGTRVSQKGLEIAFGKRAAGGLVELTLSASDGVQAALARVGQIPLPPYIDRAPDSADQERYQTVFARRPGAVAAPTAGLHFGESMLAQLERAGHTRTFVTLHVGPGTFLPPAVEDLRDHPMHSEPYELSREAATAIAEARAEGRLVVAVGTTVVRALEASAAAHGQPVAGAARTNLCIYPPYPFRVVDAVVTNFHLPRSTLLALVMAFLGESQTRAAYAEAIAARYRFFSYGDAMLIRPASRSPLGSGVAP